MEDREIFRKLTKHQRKDIYFDKLSPSDLRRICNGIDDFIMPSHNNCVIWNGYISKYKRKSRYINFFFDCRKRALHRLLYHNYIDEINDGDYIKYTCDNRGVCCNVNHMYKLKYDKYKDINKSVYVLNAPKKKSFLIVFD